MGDKTAIEWTQATWNPIRGCSRVSEGCRNCYAEQIAARFSKPGQPYEGLARMTPSGPRWTGEMRLVGGHLEDPLHWREPRRIFVNSMSDLFHEGLAEEQIVQVFDVIRRCLVEGRGHIFQILTKRALRMRHICSLLRFDPVKGIFLAQSPSDPAYRLMGGEGCTGLTNVWLGVSVENQETANERIPQLLATPAAVRWVSYEPAIGPVSFILGPDGTEHAGLNALTGEQPCCHEHPDTSEWGSGLDWVVCGGESGPGARPFDIAWARSVIGECRNAGVACFVKQIGAHPCERFNGKGQTFHHVHGALLCKKLFDPKGGDPEEWPSDLRVREYPQARTEVNR